MSLRSQLRAHWYGHEPGQQSTNSAGCSPRSPTARTKRRGKQAEARIWERYGTRGVAFVSDMCSFSRTTRAHGICHFLGLIEHARRIIAPEVLRHGGKLLKFEIDNSFAFFTRCRLRRALRA